MELEVDRHCFVCGPENPVGLHAVFQAAEGRASGSYVVRPEHQGYAGIAHGGIVAALLDEAMVYAAVTLGRWVATAELTVRYLKPVPTGGTLAVTAEVTRHARRLVECRAEVRSSGGELLASAQGKLLQGRELREQERPQPRPAPAESSGE